MFEGLRAASCTKFPKYFTCECELLPFLFQQNVWFYSKQLLDDNLQGICFSD